MNLLSAVLSVSFLFSIIRVTTPILYGAMSSMVSEHCGVGNIGIEGMMLSCALTGVLVSAALGANAWLGLLAALIVGALLGALLGFLVMELKTDPIIAGVAINLTASGATVFLLYLACGEKGLSSSLISGVLPQLKLPLFSGVPLVGGVLSGHNVLVYLAFLILPLLWLLLYKTPLGLHIRSAGKNPEALESVGVNLKRVRYLALMCSGMLAALGGAYMSMGYVSYFVRDMVAGRGFIAIAACALGNNRPKAILLACLLFGAVDAFASNPATQNIGIPTEIVGMVPYVVTVAALTLYSWRRLKKRQRVQASAA